MQTWTRNTLMALSLLLSVPCSWAIGEFSSTKAVGSAKLCPEPLTMTCAGATIEAATDGGFLQTSATVAMSSAAKAANPGVDFAALAQYDPLVLELPVLKALASSDTAVGYLTTATAQAVQAYTYSGAGSQTFTLNITVDATLSGQDNSVFGGVIAYAEDYLSGIVVDGPGTLLTNPVTFSLSATGDSTKSISFTLDPGESVYLETFLLATARSTRGPSVADAFNTMTMSFTDTTGLAVARPVPEAGSLSMLCAGLALLIGLAGRRHQSRRFPKSRADRGTT